MSSTRVHDHRFPTTTAGLPEAGASKVVRLADGDGYELRIGPVVNQLGDDRVRMLAYNGTVPGPTLRVRQGSEIVVRVRNDGDHDTTAHWHGVRLDNAYVGDHQKSRSAITRARVV
jgi:FtsP/CotA-like multicopper oxidase with cupredoxin domain